MARFLVLANACTIGAAMLLPLTTDVAAQDVMDRLKRHAEDAARREVEERAGRKAEEAARKATSGALDHAECAVGADCDAPPILPPYDALLTKGRSVAAGVVFEPSSDRLRPEASGGLAEIAKVMKMYPEIKLTIEAHVYSAGNGGANLALSDKRAAAVKAALAHTHKVSPARLVTRGLGDTQPAVANNEASRRLDRIELVKN